MVVFLNCLRGSLTLWANHFVIGLSTLQWCLAILSLHLPSLYKFPLKEWISSVVTPATNINVGGVSDSMVDIIARFQACISAGRSSELDVTNIRIALSAISGQMSKHPFIQGLLLTSMTMVDKESRGINTLAGRPETRSETERALIADAAMQLAVTSGNRRLARSLGVAACQLSMALDDLLPKALPCPGLALNWPNVLEQNFTIIDQRYVLQPNAPKRCLANE